MQNPFLKNNCLQYEASINRAVLIDTQHFTTDESIEGNTAAGVFSINAIVEEIKRYHHQLNINLKEIPEKQLPVHLNDCLQSENNIIKQTAETIARKFGERLGIILYVIKRGKSKSELERKDWPDEGWDFWQQIENIVLSGGLANGRLGNIFKQEIDNIFLKAGIKPYNIHLTKDSSLAGLTGAAMFIKETAKANLVFDFGQSFLKRGIAFFEEDTLTRIDTLPKIPSEFMDWKADEIVDLTAEASELDALIQQSILNALQEAAMKGITIGNEISISIANYIADGKIQYRGGYGKLRFISDSYDNHLANVISEKTGRKFSIKMIHDGSAIAANFMELPNAASIAIGTSLGIGFPRPKLYNKKMHGHLQLLRSF